MKVQEKEKARKLRAEGRSLLDISKELKVSKGSVSLWVRDIKLSNKQLEKLYTKNVINGWNGRSEKCREKRVEYQEEGRKRAKEGDILHMAGCMLYWAEGYKKDNKNIIRFSNSDPNMLLFFIKFLRESLKVENNKILIQINCYVNNDMSVRDIETYWSDLLNIPINQIRKTQINRIPISSKQYKKNKLLYGVCNILIYDTCLIQHIYGALQEYGGFINTSWLEY